MLRAPLRCTQQQSGASTVSMVSQIQLDTTTNSSWSSEGLQGHIVSTKQAQMTPNHSQTTGSAAGMAKKNHNHTTSMTNVCYLLHLPLPSTVFSVSANLLHHHIRPHIHSITSDISWPKSQFHYRLKRSKTDQLHRGQTIYLPRLSGPTCPYAATKHI